MTARIPVPGTFNLRDVGGRPAAGGVVRRRTLLRSDALHALGEPGRAALVDLGVDLILDLRDDFEVEAMPDDVGGLPLRVERLPVFEGAGATPRMRGATLAELYAAILEDHGDVVGAAVSRIARASDQTVLVHCTAGKDRTGIVVALALLAVGVDRDAVFDDYVASEGHLAGDWLEAMIAEVAAHGGRDTPELRLLMGGSPPAVLRSALERVDRSHGSVRRYLLDHGVSPVDLSRLRDRLVVPSGQGPQNPE